LPPSPSGTPAQNISSLGFQGQESYFQADAGGGRKPAQSAVAANHTVAGNDNRPAVVGHHGANRSVSVRPLNRPCKFAVRYRFAIADAPAGSGYPAAKVCQVHVVDLNIVKRLSIAARVVDKSIAEGRMVA
jgi:hypothetical protein